ncbi:MAG TPA: hypothetical protein VFM25_11655 [Verrucomicrobiae bacterium]|jgi:hypothetical protein|nr:hypothetical protein [Verrucomicrobiae bacterium]
MNVITLKAHYDGKQIRLDEPFALAPNARLLVTVIASASAEDERRAWHAASQAGLARAYGDSEPDYSSAVIHEKPPGE